MNAQIFLKSGATSKLYTQNGRVQKQVPSEDPQISSATIQNMLEFTKLKSNVGWIINKYAHSFPHLSSFSKA